MSKVLKRQRNAPCNDSIELEWFDSLFDHIFSQYFWFNPWYSLQVFVLSAYFNTFKGALYILGEQIQTFNI